MATSKNEPKLTHLGKLVGTWTTEATHRAFPGLVIRGTVVAEWLEGEKFVVQRARTDHPDFPASISVLGETGRDRADAPASGALSMHYFDSRGVFRVFETHLDDTTWTVQRIAPGFSQRFRGVVDDGGDTITGVWQLCEDDVTWNDDLWITYRRTR